jgi:hypothetical protein
MNLKSIILRLGRGQIGKRCNFIILEEDDWILLIPILYILDGFELYLPCLSRNLSKLFKLLYKSSISLKYTVSSS